MYDKYTSATQFSVNGTKLPKHKGLLFSNTTKSTLTATMQFLNVSGNTTNVNFYIPQETTTFVPMQAYAGITMPGLTAWFLN